jgi:TPR repeat protein
MTSRWRIAAWRGLLPLLVTLMCFSSVAEAQREPNSPVFKKYRPPAEYPLIQQSDPTYQIAQTFLLTRRANAGDPVAQHELGIRYLTGIGVDADTVRAAFWIKKAADQNVTPARFNMAILCYHGWGIPWNPFESHRYFLSAAELDMPEAQYAVAVSFVENLIMPEDWAEGHRWMKKASDAGYKPATEVLKTFEQKLAGLAADSAVRPTRDSSAARGYQSVIAARVPVPIDFAEDTVSTSKDQAMLKEAIVRADPELKQALGLPLSVDTSAVADSTNMALVQASADGGSPEALTLLARCAEKGIDMAKDPVLAAAYYVRAIRMDSQRAARLLWELVQPAGFVAEMKTRAERGDPSAQFVWAGLFSLGYDEPLMRGQAYITKQQAAQLLHQAVEQRHIPSMIELGLWHYAGRWVTHDEVRAVALWKQASRAGSREADLRLAITAVRAKASDDERTRAVRELEDAAQRGSVLAVVGLGYCYETGTVYRQSASDAAQLYRTAWRRGSQDAYRALRRLHDRVRPPDPKYQMKD